VTISGFNPLSQKVIVFRFLLDISLDYTPGHEENNSSIDPAHGIQQLSDLPSSPIPLDYFTYDTSKGVTLSPEQRLVSFDSNTKTLTIQGDTPLGTTVHSTVDLSSELTITSTSSLIAMSCSDTDVSKTLNNACYVLMSDTSAGNTCHMYQLSNLNADGTGALTPIITPLTLNLSTTQGLTKAVIDNSTGALLTLSPGVSTPDNTVVYLYTLTGNSYNPGQLITLPPTTGSASDQYASNIYEY
jgi:hypothetical protein